MLMFPFQKITISLNLEHPVDYIFSTLPIKIVMKMTIMTVMKTRNTVLKKLKHKNKLRHHNKRNQNNNGKKKFLLK